jgi:hypothetical protein
MGRIKDSITPPDAKIKEAKEKMDINNEIKNAYST